MIFDGCKLKSVAGLILLAVASVNIDPRPTLPFLFAAYPDCGAKETYDSRLPPLAPKFEGVTLVYRRSIHNGKSLELKARGAKG